MAKIKTFKKRKDFLRVASGFHIATHNMVLQATRCLSESSDIWVGFTATKRVGNAVCRNKCKRRLRAIARELLPKQSLTGIDYVFIARNSTADCDFNELKQDTLYALKKINKNFLPENGETELDDNENI